MNLLDYAQWGSAGAATPHALGGSGGAETHTQTHTHKPETNLRIELGVANTHTEASSKLLRLLTYNAPTSLEELIFSMSVVMITIV